MRKSFILKTVLPIAMATITCAAWAAHDIMTTKQPAERTARAGRAVKAPLRADGYGVSRLVPTMPRLVPGSNTVLCGTMVYNDDWANAANPITAGIYTFEAKPDGKFSTVYVNSDMMGVRAAVKVNNSYYVYTQKMAVEDAPAYLETYSTTSWNRTGRQEISYPDLPSDLTYDPVTGKVYGWFYSDSDDDRDFNIFGSFSLSTGQMTQIGRNDRGMYAIAADPNGNIYSISSTGRLYLIDPKNANTTYIGSTGVFPAEERNSMTFDEATGKLYWAATTEAFVDGKRVWTGALYEVNTTNAQLTKVMDMPGNASFAGVYAMPYEVPASAPAAVSNLAMTMDSPLATHGTITFTAPVTTMDGAALTTPVSAIVESAAGERVIEDIAPGSPVTVPDITLPQGMQTITVTTADDDYRGGQATITLWVGEDVPGNPTNVVLDERDGKPFLSWDAPVRGKNGGNYDTDAVTYRVTRYPDAVTVADGLKQTSMVDETTDGQQSSLYYTVTAITPCGQSDAVASNKMVFGDGYVVPFVEEFATIDRFELWTIVDNNGGGTWAYDASAKTVIFKYDNQNTPGDDWFISPKIMLHAGVNYKLSFFGKTLYRNYKENFRVALGKQPTPGALTQTLCDFIDYENTAGENLQQVFTVDADGYYYLGFYNYSEGRHWQLTIDNVGITEIDNHVPAAVTDLTVTPAEQGALEATVSFTAPQVDVEGGALRAITAIKVYRGADTTPVYTFSNPTPGAQLTWTDRGMSGSGTYIYRVVPENEAGEGAEARTEAFVGMDVPGPVTNLLLTDRDGVAVLTWDAPTTGANGGYFDASQLNYQVWRYDVIEQKASGLTTTNFSDPNLNITVQTPVQYVVYSCTGDTRNSYALTPYVIFGEAYPTPFVETFASSEMNHSPWMSRNDRDLAAYLWTLDDAGYYPATADQNGDRGLATFNAHGAVTGAGGWLMSPKVDVSGLDTPQLSFWMYHSHDSIAGGNEMMQVELSVDGGDFVAIAGSELARDNGTDGWMRHTVELDGVRGAQYVRVAFHGTTAGGLNIYLDNITIDNAIDVDLQLTSLDAPSRIAQGETAHITAVVTNAGRLDVSAAELHLTDAQGHQLATSAIPTLPSGQQAVVDVPVATQETGTIDITAAVLLPEDSNRDNNTATATMQVVTPVVPAALNLTGQLHQGRVSLTWLSPLSQGAVTDSVETYEDFAIESVGDWTMVDRDHDVTYKINTEQMPDYPHQNEAKAFQVVNAHTLGIDIYDTGEGTPHSGNKFFMSIASVNIQNNDWLISPRLNGTQQVISFWAKAFTDQNALTERMRVYYSTTGTDPSDFKQLNPGDYMTVPSAWSQYSYVVPEGTRYFAVQGCSPGGDASFALFVDDLSFNDLTVPTWQLTGYEVYRNGVKVGETSTESFTDIPGAVGKATYAIRAIYDRGAAPMSEGWIMTNPADIDHNGIIDIADINAIINVMLNPAADNQQATAADVTRDGKVDVTDINAVINAMLGK